MSDIAQQRAKLQAGLTDVMLVLYEFATAPAANSSIEARRLAIEQIRKRVLKLRLEAGESGWNTLHDACMHLEQNLASWSEGEFDPVAVSDPLERWVSELSTHTELSPDAPLSAKLQAWLASPVWPVVYESLPQPDGDTSQTFEASPAKSAVLDALRDELTSLLQQLQTSASAGDVTLHSFADSLQVFGIAAAGAGYLGLMDACTLLRHAIAQDTAPSASPQHWVERIARWCDAAQLFLSAPDTPQASYALLALHRDAVWLPRLDTSDYSALAELFHCDAAAVSAEPAPTLPTAISTPEINTPVASSESAPAPVVLTAAANELVQLVRAEVERHQATLHELLATMNDSAQSVAQRSAAASTFAEHVNRFALGVESVGLIGLKRVFEHVRSNLQTTAEHAHDATILQHFEQLVPLVKAYLDDIAVPATVSALVDYVASSTWPVSFAELDTLRSELSQPKLITEDENAEQRPTEALPEHVSLTLPQDADPRLLESLLQELPHHTAEFSAAVVRMTRGDAGKHDVDVAQRIAHTLKGSANTVGVAGIAQLTHHIEDVLMAYAKVDRVPSGALANVLQNAADVIEAMSEHLLGQGTAPHDALQVLQEVLDWANRIDHEGIPADDATVPVSNSGATPARAATVNDEDAVATLRVPATLIDELLRLVGESIIVTGQLKNKLQLALAENKSVAKQNALFQKLTYELEQIVDVQGISASATGKNYQDFDSLEMDEYNELHTVTRRLVEAATDSREMTQGVEDHLLALNELVVQQARVQKENQDVVMRTRMVPAQTLVPRLQRAVRQTCRLTQKNVELEVYGADTLMDSEILNAIADPLMHVLRNSIDHGVEPEAQRIAANKPPQGRINLRFTREGDHVVITCSDDGAGIDFDAVRATAQARGLLAADAEVGEAELTKLILQPGFTTRSLTTQTSGRGIGLDAVNSRVLELKGSLAISALRGQGCGIEIRLPLTLISVHALLTRINDQVVAVSTRGVEQILHSSVGLIERDGDTVYHTWNGERMQGALLEQLLDVGTHRDIESIPLEARPALVVRIDATDRRVVWIDQIVATQDLVVKQLGAFLPKLAGIEGVTILGSGRVAAVLDLPDLLRAGPVASASEASSNTQLHVEQRRVALVVDDSLSARRALAELMQDLGYQVHAARDGIEAVELLDLHGADIVLADLEMPRMNGLELAAHIRAQSKLKHIPIIMVTSRSTDKHRQQATSVGVNVYLNKPFAEDELVRHVEQLLTQTQPATQQDNAPPNSSEQSSR